MEMFNNELELSAAKAVDNFQDIVAHTFSELIGDPLREVLVTENCSVNLLGVDEAATASCITHAMQAVHVEGNLETSDNVLFKGFRGGWGQVETILANDRSGCLLT